MSNNKKLRPGNVINKAGGNRLARLKEQGVVDVDKATESVNELMDLPMEVEEIRFLQRQMTKSGTPEGEVDSKLIKERDARNEYNQSLLQINSCSEPTLYSKIRIPKGYIAIKLFKKPIFEINGFLKPDLIKRPKSDSSGQERGFYYEENKFPYLDAGVVVNATEGVGDRFDLTTDEMVGAIVSLKIGTRIDQKVLFIDKSEINPTYYEGHILVSMADVEFVLATVNDDYRMEMFEKVIGNVTSKNLQDKINNEIKHKPTIAPNVVETIIDNTVMMRATLDIETKND